MTILPTLASSEPLDDLFVEGLALLCISSSFVPNIRMAVDNAPRTRVHLDGGHLPEHLLGASQGTRQQADGIVAALAKILLVPEPRTSG
jgi:hypothetical protein